MRGRRLGSALLLLLLLSASHQSTGSSPPGKPVLLGCRSPEKETFTCWWRPGSDGGLQTVHHLHYEREDLEGARECPDYRSGGENSCFFDKNHTFIWVYYYLTVVASNSRGNVSSEPLKLDVMDIVKPDPPENVSLQVEQNQDSRHLHVRWQRPSNTDPGSGWVTIKYQLRVKQESSSEWNHYTSGTQTSFSLYSIRPRARYMVQVRCALDHGQWSEWSNVTYVTIPNYLESERPFWILLSTLSVVSLFASMCVLVIKRKDVKQILLPPVPGPKIKGLNIQLLQCGQSDDVINALLFHENFPPMADGKEQTEEYLVVSERDDWRRLDRSNPVKKKTCASLSADSYIDSEIQHAQLIFTQKESKEVNKSIDARDLFASQSQSQFHTSKQQSPCANFQNINVADLSSIRPLANSSGYVAVQRRTGATQEDYGRVSGDRVLTLEKESVPLGLDVGRPGDSMPEGYSRVEEVKSDNTVLLHKQADSSCKEKRNIDAGHSNQKSGNPSVTGQNNLRLCTELFGNGYVDSVPSLPLV